MAKTKACPNLGAKYILGCCFYLMTVPAVAQSTGDNQETVSKLDSITVIGTVDNLQGLDFYAPNSSAVIDSKQIEATGARKLDQALQYQSGVLSEPFGADNKVDWFKIRGFDASISIDGTPTTPNGYFVWKQELFGLESIEVVKGANSLLFGAAETGGVVNLVTKKPTGVESLLLNAELGNNHRKGLGLDYNGLLGTQENVYYRIVAQAREEGGMQDHTKMKSYYLAPSITIDFNDKNSLTLLSSIQHEDGRPTNGFLPAYGTIIDTPYGLVNRHTNMGEPDFDHLKRTQINAGWTFKHKFTNDWQYVQNYRFSKLELDQQNVFAYGSDNYRNALRGYTYTKGHTNNHYFDNKVTGKLQLGENIKIEPTAGFDYLKSDTSGNNNGFGFAPALDMFNPSYGSPFPVDYTPYELNSKQLGIYAAAKINVGSHWNFNIGLRHDKAKGDSFIDGFSSPGYNVSNNSINAGAIYISDYGISPYIGYSESFKPENGIDGYGNPYIPYIGKQTEIGLKIEPDWLNGTFTLAYFDIEEKNALAADASNIQKQIGKKTNKGIELQGELALSANTNARLAYTYNHSKQDLSANQTVRTALIPKHQASLWLDHSFNFSSGNKLTLAAGIRYNGSTEDQQYYPGETIPSYTLLDLMAKYQINRNLSLQVNARNVTNKSYISGCDFYCYYGNDRSIDMQLQYQWQ